MFSKILKINCELSPLVLILYHQTTIVLALGIQELMFTIVFFLGLELYVLLLLYINSAGLLFCIKIFGLELYVLLL